MSGAGDTGEAHEARETGARIEELLAILAASSDPAVPAAAAELVRLLLVLHGDGLGAMLAAVEDAGEAGPGLRARLVDDPAVESLLLLHGLHPLEVAQRVTRALDRIRPHLPGEVEYLGTSAEGVARLRLRRRGGGCGHVSPASAARAVIRAALLTAAPEIAEVEVAETAGPAGPVMVRIGPPPTDGPPAPALPRIGPAPHAPASGPPRSALAGASPPAPAAAPAPERCELCGTAAGPRHPHLADLAQATLICVCRACHLLFAAEGAGGRRRRAVPQRYLRDAAHPVSTPEWESLGVPVGLAFFCASSQLGRVAACYPSPAGATECLLDLPAWTALAASHPLLAAAAPDVEAVLISAGPPVESYLIPIDACYELTGRIRSSWRGLGGGEESRRAAAAFLADVRARAHDLAAC